jgi:hypothetical protein
MEGRGEAVRRAVDGAPIEGRNSVVGSRNETSKELFGTNSKTQT